MEHPMGIEPWGAFYLKSAPERREIRTAGLGRLAQLADEHLVSLLFECSGGDLARLACVSKALYAFTHTPDLWKSLVLEELGMDFAWRGSWRETWLAHQAPGYLLGSHKPIRLVDFYSDFLHQPFACAHAELQPEWLTTDNVERRSGLSPQQFRTEYEAANRPVLLVDAAAHWPALRKWSREHLAAALAGRPVIVGNAAWRFSTYAAYCDDCGEDEMPLYLFDKAFASACPSLCADYSVPDVFQDDLFQLLGEAARPDYRWLIIGPRRSGSSFHVDPNATCAWNAVVSGSKKWILYPPGAIPPGVHPSPDGADVAAPVSLVEWFRSFYGQPAANGVAPLECIVRPGEVLYIPRGWWHLALNLEHTVAVTQNFVSSVGLRQVLAFLQTRSAHLVSGCRVEDRSSLYDRFVAALAVHRPELLARSRDGERLSQMFKAATVAAGFSFGFDVATGKVQALGAAGESAHAAAGTGLLHGCSSAVAQQAAADGRAGKRARLGE